MKERKKMTGFVQDTIVPEIVNRKCQEAYDIIYRECRQKNRNITMKICNEENKPEEEIYRNCEHAEGKINIKKIVSIASCAAVLAAGLLIPMTWSGLPTLKNSINNSEPKSSFSSSESENENNIPEPESAFSFISKKMYRKDAAVKSDLTPYAADAVYESLNCRNDMTDITLQSVYCDSFNLAIALSLTVKDKDLFENTTNIEGYCDVVLNGSSLEEYPERRIMGFTGEGDGNYYAVLSYPMLYVEDGSKLEIKISDLYGTNAYKQIGDVNPIDYSVCYNPEKTVSISDEYYFLHTIKVDTSHNYYYDVNDTYDDVNLEGIMVTPYSTLIDITCSSGDYSIDMTDQNGEVIGLISSGDGKWCFSPPYRTSEMLNIDVIRFYNMDDYGPDVCTFQVPIDGGFAEKNTVDYNNSIIDQSKIVYDPPLEKLEEENRNNQKMLYDKIKSEVIPESVLSKITEYYSDNRYLNWAVISGAIGEVEDFENRLENDWCIEQYEKQYGSLEDAKMLLVTCEIYNCMGYSVSDVIMNGPTLISKDYFNVPENYGLLNEYHYVSCESDIYEFAPYETKYITFGYIVPQKCIDAGYWACFWGKNGHSNSDFNDILSGNATLCEIN